MPTVGAGQRSHRCPFGLCHCELAILWPAPRRSNCSLDRWPGRSRSHCRRCAWTGYLLYAPEIPLSPTFDALALPALLVAVFGWAGCAAAGCASGLEVIPGQVPFAVYWPDMYGIYALRWPVQIIGMFAKFVRSFRAGWVPGRAAACRTKGSSSQLQSLFSAPSSWPGFVATKCPLSEPGDWMRSSMGFYSC